MTDLTIKDLAVILRHGARTAAMVFTLIFAITLFAMFLFAPEYEVSTTILIEQEDPSALLLPNPAALLMGGFQAAQNETELIKSRVVIDALIEKFNLQFPVERTNETFFRQFVGKFRGEPDFIGAPYFAQVHSSLANEEGIITATETGYFIENSSEKVECIWGKPCLFKNGEIILEKAGEMPVGEQYEFSYRNYVKARKAVRESYDAFPLGESKTPSLFRVSMETTNTPFASLFLNELVTVFAAKKVQWRTETTEVTRGFLEKLAARLKDERDEKLRKLTTFMSNSRTILPDEQVKTLVLQKLELEQQKKEIDIRRSLIGEFRKIIEEGGSRMLPAPMLDDDKAFGEVVATYNMLVMEEKKASELYFDSHPDLIMLRQQLSAARKTIGTMADDTDSNIRQVESLLSTKIGAIDSEMRRLPPELSELAVLKAEEQAVEKIYWFLNEKLYENEIKKESMKHDIRVIDRADPNEEKLFPRISISMMLAFALALLLSLGTVFGHYLFRRTVPFGEEVSRFVGTAYRRFDLPWVGVTHSAEDLDARLLRIMVSSGLLDKRAGTIAVCSIEPGAGKTFLAGRLAQMLTDLGYRTALLGQTAGTTPQSDKHQPAQPALHRLDGDSATGTLVAADGIGLKKIRALREQYDFVILDTPPMSASVEALIAAAESDRTFFVVRAGNTPRAIFKKYFSILSERSPRDGQIVIAVNDSAFIPS